MSVATIVASVTVQRPRVSASKKNLSTPHRHVRRATVGSYATVDGGDGTGSRRSILACAGGGASASSDATVSAGPYVGAGKKNVVHHDRCGGWGRRPRQSRGRDLTTRGSDGDGWDEVRKGDEFAAADLEVAPDDEAEQPQGPVSRDVGGQMDAKGAAGERDRRHKITKENEDYSFSKITPLPPCSFLFIFDCLRVAFFLSRFGV